MPQQPALTPTRIAEVLERTPTSSFVGGRFLGGTAALEVIDPATGAALTRVVDADAASVGAKALDAPAPRRRTGQRPRRASARRSCAAPTSCATSGPTTSRR